MQQSVNIRETISRIKRHPLLQDIPFETLIDYLLDFIQIVGAPNLYEEKIADVKVEEHRGVLPCDFINCIQVRQKAKPHSAYRYATDSFHLKPEMHKVGECEILTYKIQGNFIFTSKRKDDLEISYRAICVDEEGLPLIPDNPVFKRAFESFVKKEWFQILFDLGKIQANVFTSAQQDYAWNVGCCETEFKRLTIDEMETLSNVWKGLLLKDDEHRKGFKNTGEREHIKVQY